MVTYQFGNTRVIIDESYIQSATEEQKRIDQELLADAAWAIYDELIEAGEEV